MLRGECVGLRAIEEEDLPQLLIWRNKTNYRQYFREYRELNTQQQCHWYEKVVIDDHRTIMFAVVDLPTNDLIGACGLCYIDWINKNADFSIYIGIDNLYIDSKLAVDAANILVKYAFLELGLHRLWSEIYDFDDKKIEFFNKIGFTLDGRHRQTHWCNGTWHDSLFYGLLSNDFIK